MNKKKNNSTIECLIEGLSIDNPTEISNLICDIMSK